MTQFEKPLSFAVKHKDENVRAESRSGGIFTALSDYVIENGGVVFGCILDDCFNATHMRAESKEERDLMRGSKYIQSNMGRCFSDVKKDLSKGSTVLFTGTACQIAGLKGFLGKDYEDLFCVDIVCHGVPSPEVWQKYLNWICKGRTVTVINFRNKQKYGWADHVVTVHFDNGEEFDDRAFVKLFGKCYIERPSCFKCPYKSINRESDITIADYWGIDNADPEMNDNKGVSLVLVNNEKGEKYFDSIKNRIIYKATRLEDSTQPESKTYRRR